MADMNHFNHSKFWMALKIMTCGVLLMSSVSLADGAPPKPNDEACTINQKTGACLPLPDPRKIQAESTAAPEPAAGEVRPSDEPGGKKLKRRKKGRPIPTSSTPTPASEKDSTK